MISFRAPFDPVKSINFDITFSLTQFDEKNVQDFINKKSSVTIKIYLNINYLTIKNTQIK